MQAKDDHIEQCMSASRGVNEFRVGNFWNFDNEILPK